MFWKKKTLEEKVKAKVKSTLSKKIADLINNNLEVCIQFDTDNKKMPELGDSKYGGLPHYMSNTLIPKYNSRPLKFIAQINCKDLEPLQNFPHEGMLYVFLDVVDSPDSFPEKRGQFKVHHIQLLEIPAAGVSTGGDRQDSYKLEAIESINIHENQSYIFDGIDVPEEDVYKIIDLQFGAIPDIVGNYGRVKIGGIPDMHALWDWAYQHTGYVDANGVVDWSKIELSKAEAQTNAQKTLKDFELLFTIDLDSYGHTDSWIHIGIHKDDLRQRNFENVYASFIST